MLSFKKCTCGASTFRLLMDTKIAVTCVGCGTLFLDPTSLPDMAIDTNFKLGLV